jgi:hypothetical protein
MKWFIVLSSIIIAICLTTACRTSVYVCNVEQRDSTFKHIAFNNDFIKDLKSYEQLAAFLKTNADSIFAYNPSSPNNNVWFIKDENGKLVHAVMPPSILNEFMVLCKELEHISLSYFHIYKPGNTVEITIGMSKNKGLIEVDHSLNWNQRHSLQEQNDFNNSDSPLYKDTMLNENVKYQISVGCHF